MPDACNWNSAWFAENCEKFLFLTSFDPLNIDPVTPNLHHNVFLCGPTHLPNLVLLAHIGAEIAGGNFMPPLTGWKVAGRATACRVKVFGRLGYPILMDFLKTWHEGRRHEVLWHIFRFFFKFLKKWNLLRFSQKYRFFEILGNKISEVWNFEIAIS